MPETPWLFIPFSLPPPGIWWTARGPLDTAMPSASSTRQGWSPPKPLGSVSVRKVRCYRWEMLIFLFSPPAELNMSLKLSVSFPLMGCKDIIGIFIYNDQSLTPELNDFWW